MIVNRVCCLVLRSPVCVMKRVKCSSVSSPQRLSWSGTSPGTWPGKESESGTSTSNGLWPGPWCIIIHAINFSQWVQFGFGCVYYRNIASLCSWPSLIWGTWNFVPDVLTYVCTWGIRRFGISLQPPASCLKIKYPPNGNRRGLQVCIGFRSLQKNFQVCAL